MTACNPQTTKKKIWEGIYYTKNSYRKIPERDLLTVVSGLNQYKLHWHAYCLIHLVPLAQRGAKFSAGTLETALETNLWSGFTVNSMHHAVKLDIKVLKNDFFISKPTEKNWQLIRTVLQRLFPHGI